MKRYSSENHNLALDIDDVLQYFPSMNFGLERNAYIRETGRNLNTRLTEHKREIKNGDMRNHIAEHHRLTKHIIDCDSAECVTYSTNYQQPLTLESWYTNLEQEPLNRCQQLPAPYKQLIHDPKRNRQTSTNNRRMEINSQTKTDKSLQLLHFDDQSHHRKTDQTKPKPEA